MKIDVPFFENKANDCGPVALQMVLAYFEKDISLEKIKQTAAVEASGVTWTLGLAKAAAEQGCKVAFYTTKLGAVHNNEYYQQHADMEHAPDKLKKLLTHCQTLGVVVKEEKLDLQTLLQHVTKTCIPIVLVDWNVIANKEGYLGHFLPLVGYDGDHVIVHQPGPQPTPFLTLDRELFDKARKAKGTDEDVVVVSHGSDDV
ncbi:hypothetical protein CMO91_02915 [Candidatus Woesearchaeota archaeon]|nr:hypothetical protein [Candidatus Woesearchaeota archaeon]|tara:strand:+ start:852 stop:1454 length:603 start_codon:yes stop_codon:yes gene_type:complete